VPTLSDTSMNHAGTGVCRDPDTTHSCGGPSLRALPQVRLGTQGLEHPGGDLVSAKKGTFRAALSHRDFRLVLAGGGVSYCGDWMFGVSLLAYVYDETRSAAWVAAAGFLRLAPYLLFGTLGGVIADRYERRALMMATDAARAVLMFVLAAVALASGPVSLAIALTFVSSALAAPSVPALLAMTPSLVGEDDLAAANSAMSVIDNIGLVVGPAVGGALLLVGSPAAAFAINGATFLVSLACMARVRVRSEGASPDEADTPMLERLVVGFRAIAGSSDVVLLMAVSVASAMLYGQETVLLVLVSQRLLDAGSEGVGFLFAAIGVGGLVGAGAGNRLARDPKAGRTLALTLLLSGGALIGLAFTTSRPVAYALLALDGAGAVILEVLAITMLQRTVSQDVLARVFGIDVTISVGAALLGALVAPLTLAAFGLRPALVIAGGLLPLLALVAAPRLRALNARANETLSAIQPRVELLRRIAIFHGASHQALEALAIGAREERVAAGDVVIAEGDAPDFFYVVRSGRLRVLSSGEAGGAPVEANTMTQGDYFGEIGLVEGMPRTATVQAITESELLTIDGEHFLNAVGQAPNAGAALAAGLASRLARTHPSYSRSVPLKGET
jgi:predicted MFS family arabinose efflux permease